MKKNILLLIGLFIFCDTFYFSYVNSGLLVDFKYPPLIESFNFDNGLMMFSIALYIALGTYLIIYHQIAVRDEKIKKLSRSSEKVSIQSEENTDKIKILEDKIKTLELALKNSLEDK